MPTHPKQDVLDSLPYPSYLVTSQEEKLLQVHAMLTAIDAVNVLATIAWFITNDISAGGLGAALSHLSYAFAGLAVGGVGILVLFSALWLQGFFYEILIKDAKSLQEDLCLECEKSVNNQKALFLQLLKLRRNFKDDNDFNEKIKQKLSEYDNTVNIPKICELVNKTYQNTENRKTLFLREANNFQYNPKELKECFYPLAEPKVKNWINEVVKPGVVAGFLVASTLIGCGWTFSSLLIAASLAATLPIVGWALFLGIGIVTAIAMGIKIGLINYKISKGREFVEEMKATNEKLEQASLCLSKNESQESSVVVEYGKRPNMTGPFYRPRVINSASRKGSPPLEYKQQEEGKSNSLVYGVYGSLP